MKTKKTSETPQQHFDALLQNALLAHGDAALQVLPTPDALLKAYPDTARWDARLAAQTRARRPLRVLRRALVVAAVLLLTLATAMTVSAEVRYAVYDTIYKWTKIELILTHSVQGGIPRETLPEGYTDHVVLEGFVLDTENAIESEDMFFHGYNKIDGDTRLSYTVDCYVIRPTGQIETFDNEHTEYTTIDLDGVEATLGTSSNFDGSTSYYLFWEKDGVAHTVHSGVSLEETLSIAKGIY